MLLRSCEYYENLNNHRFLRLTLNPKSLLAFNQEAFQLRTDLLTGGDLPGFKNREDLVSEKFQAPLCNFIWSAAKSKGHVQLKIPNQFSAFFKSTQDLVRRAPTGRLHETADRSVVTGSAGNLCLLLIGVVAFHSLEVLAKELVVIEIALHEFTLVSFGLFFALGRVSATDDKISEHHVGRFSAMILTVQLPCPAEPPLPVRPESAL